MIKIILIILLFPAIVLDSVARAWFALVLWEKYPLEQQEWLVDYIKAILFSKSEPREPIDYKPNKMKS